MTWQEFLAQLNQQQGSSGSAGGASVSSDALGLPGNLTGSIAGLGGLATSPFGGNPASGAAGLGGTVGDIAGTLAGLPFGIPFGGAIGGFLGDLIGSLVGGGVPREAKTSALGGALQGSGNPLDALVGQFIGQGANQGRVLSESSPSTFGQSTYDLSSFLSALTGQQLPGVTATGFGHNPSFTPEGLGRAGTQFQLPAGYNFLNQAQAPDAAKVIEQIVGMQQPAMQPKVSQDEWQKVVQQLISKGDLTKYNGPMGAVGAGPTSPGAIPNLSLPHPLAQNQPQTTPAPYPLMSGN